MLETKNKITWCPGCPNYLIKQAIQTAITKLIQQGYPQESFVVVTDIGCNSKIYDYLDLSAFYGLHGRAIPTGFGVKVGNPKLNVLVIAGDGGTYNEGLDHFIHACRYNINLTLLVHNNGAFSLTTGQASATTKKGYIEKTHPFGVQEDALNPLSLALDSGASFVARTSALDLNQMIIIIEQGIKHPGFSFIDILQPCLIYNNFSEVLKKNSYMLKNSLPLEKALVEARKSAFALENPAKEKIALGVFFQEKKPTFEEKYHINRNI